MPNGIFGDQDMPNANEVRRFTCDNFPSVSITGPVVPVSRLPGPIPSRPITEYYPTQGRSPAIPERPITEYYPQTPGGVVPERTITPVVPISGGRSPALIPEVNITPSVPVGSRAPGTIPTMNITPVTPIRHKRTPPPLLYPPPPRGPGIGLRLPALVYPIQPIQPHGRVYFAKGPPVNGYGSSPDGLGAYYPIPRGPY